MTHNHKSIDSYINSAKKVKSPISKDDARSLIDSGGIVYNTKFWKQSKGVKIMSLIASLVTVGLIGFYGSGIYDTEPKSNEIKKEAISSSIHTINTGKIAEKEATNGTVKIIQVDEQQEEIEKNKGRIATATRNAQTGASSDPSEIDPDEVSAMTFERSIHALNQIVLTEEEMKRFNIIRDTIEGREGQEPAISYYNRIKDNLVYESYYTKGSSHTFFDKDKLKEQPLPLSLSPKIITDFKGTVRSKTYGMEHHLRDIEEFVPFHVELTKFLEFDFKEGKFPNTLPKDIDNLILDFGDLSEKYQQNWTNELSSQIKSNLIKLNAYFYLLSTSNEDDKYEDNVDMVIYSDTPNSDENQQHIKGMLDKGIKVRFEKPRLILKNHIKELYPVAGENITSLGQQISKYVMVNKLVAVKIPYLGQQDDGVIFWFEPSEKLLDLLPERYREQLRKEFDIIKNPEAICAAPIDRDNAYMDVFRACSDDIKNLKLFPNPVRNNLSVSFELEDNSKTITCAIYNTAGEQVKPLLVKQQFTLGKNLLTFDVSDLQSNMYLFTIKSGKDRAVLRFIKE